MVKQCFLLVFSLLFSVHCSFAQSDTAKIHLLNEVEIRALSVPSSYKASAPLQMRQGSDLNKINALRVSDVLKFFSGVQVKDYGGIGGLKTVSVRSLGANYTTVAYDGVGISDYQTGQIDLGRFSLDNIERISLNTGGSNDIFQPAKNQSLSSFIDISTHSFHPTETKKSELKAAVQSGSWKMFNPSLSFSRALNSTFVIQASTEYLSSKGNYPFTMYYETANDSSARKQRNNSEVKNWKCETNLHGHFKNGGQLAVKMYYFDSDRNIPGAAIAYNDYAGESLEDRNFFSQVRYVQPIREKWSLQTHAKFTRSDMAYSDRLHPELRSRYEQQEYYLSAVLLYKVSDRLSFSWANDGIQGRLEHLNERKNLAATRTTGLSAFSGKYETAAFTFNASVLSNYTDDTPKTGINPDRPVHFSPYIACSVQPSQKLPVRLRAYYKNTYRLPTMADIYYPNLPNTNLKPENARQFNLGWTTVTSWNEQIPFFSLSCDVYYNKVENKIMATPRSSLALWSVQNFGEVHIKGIDLNMQFHVHVNKDLATEISGTYTRQDVLDQKTGQQLRYTPRGFASGSAALKTPWLDMNYHFVYCGNRYYNETPSSASLLKRYMDQGFSLTKTVSLKNCRLYFSAECLNVLNVRYEVVHSFPMPGRSFRSSIKFIY